MEQLVIGIRADGNAKIGMGHLMRCLSVAIALKENKIEVIFIVKNTQSGSFVGEKGFTCLQLTGQYATMEAEVAETLELLAEHHVNLLLIDSYQATEYYLEQINAVIPVFYMDDLGRMALPVSGIINYNIYVQDMGYERYYPEDVALLLGSKYAPVKPEFRSTPYQVRTEVRNILVTMGGSDFLNIAGQLGALLLELLPEHVHITLICGRFSPLLEAVQALSAENARLQVLTDVSDMWNQMAKCDIAIAAAGSTMYELCTMGVPTVCCYYVENQHRAAEGFAVQTSMINAGDFSKNPEMVLGLIAEKTRELLADFTLRRQLSTEMRAVSDGKGSLRIAQKLCDYLKIH